MRKILSIVLTIVIIATSAFGFCPEAQAARQVHHSLPFAKSALVVDKQTGKTLFSRSPQVRRAPASTVKLLTALVVVDALPLDSIVRVHSSVVGTQPSHIHLQSGERFYVRDLLKAVLINSANDAARALAIAVSGSEHQFAERMNQKAKALGAQRSNFMTSNGLPAKNQYSTVYDLVQIMRAAERNSFIMNTLAIKTTTIQSFGGRSIHLKNHNKMLWSDSREFIGKTGWTRHAKHCFVGIIRHQGTTVYVALMGSNKKWSDLAYFADRYIGRRSVQKSSQQTKEIRSVGSRGEDVRKIQEALKHAGFFHRSPTGYFGPVTKRAVLQFQKANNLSQDGVVGPRTQAALNQYL